MKTTSRPVVPGHGGQLRQLAAHYNVPVTTLVDFSANINPEGPPPSVRLAIERALVDPATLTTYPDLELTELKRVIASCAGVDSDKVAVANGFASLLEAALRSLDVRRCLLPVPAFSEYRRTLERVKAELSPLQLDSQRGFLYEPEAIFAASVAGECDAILLANPQNPSGALCESGKMLRLVQMAAEHRVTVLLDEAFIDYRPEQSVTRLAAEYSNLIVFRSVTKFFAIPGLRVAYAVCNSSNAERLNGMIAPWPITSFAADAVCAALVEDAYGEHSRLLNEQRRSWLEQRLKGLNIATYQSGANFLLLRFAEHVDAGLVWERMIVEERVVLRSCANFEGLEAGHLRIAVRSEQDNERLVDSLRRVLCSL